ncbi:MAG TPA: NAD(P)/FAD-dependent oxidoreductase [Pseudorhodoferax sp.]|nr:NAD(P)/FAD-dependent oxidoreductase [Pseudorhodoferax sp.]
MPTPVPPCDAFTQLRHDAETALQFHGPTPSPWVVERAGVDEQVVVVGAGHSGLAIGLALQRAGVRVVLIDAAGPQAPPGIWTTKARMRVLRTPKLLAGPEVELQALSFRHWYETQHGAAAYQALPSIGREDWSAYLVWFRSVTGLDIRRETELLALLPRPDGHVGLQLRHAGQTFTRVARKVVLATGVVGSGAPFLPAVLSDLRGSGRVWHADDAIDFSRMQGARVAVLGAAASGFDVAAAALEGGAAQVSLFSRRPDLVRGSAARGLGFPGAQESFCSLPDTLRWQAIRAVRAYGGGAPFSSLERVAAQPAFRLHLAEAWQQVSQGPGETLQVRTQRGTSSFDCVVAATGYRVDLAQRPEMEQLRPAIRLWAQQVPAAWVQEDEELGRFPYLGEGFEFLEAAQGSLPSLAHVHCFNYGAFASFGRLVGDVPSLRLGVPRLVRHILRDLLLADQDEQLRRMTAQVSEDFSRDDYLRLFAGRTA